MQTLMSKSDVKYVKRYTIMKARNTDTNTAI